MEQTSPQGPLGGEGWNERTRYEWFVALHNVSWERPERGFDEEVWEWHTFAADWAREILRGGSATAF